MATIDWVYYPKSDRAPELAVSVVQAFQSVAAKIASDHIGLTSNQVLAVVRPGLLDLGFQVEGGKKRKQKIPVPVLFGLNGRIEKSFDADAYHPACGFVLEVEAGRGIVNNQFLKDLFQACMMHDVDYLGIAVRRVYRSMWDFDHVMRFFDTLYASNRLKLPLSGILVIGY
jgi:hypothetical protein